jgi:hypothetical protein
MGKPLAAKKAVYIPKIWRSKSYPEVATEAKATKRGPAKMRLLVVLHHQQDAELQN